MFSGLTEKLTSTFSGLFRAKALTESNIQEAIQEVRLALLEADVQYAIVKEFIKAIKEQAVGQQLLSKEINPGQQFVKIVHDQIVKLLGGSEAEFLIKRRPTVAMLVGLQASGKTTAAAKLARYAKEKLSIFAPCLVACDLARPAAIEQLKVLADQVGAQFFSLPGATKPIEVVKAALDKAKTAGWDFIILDTAGRLAIDEALMDELKELKALANPDEVVFVLNGAIGQEGVQTAQRFAQAVGMTGTIVTMLDGSSRAGAVLSINKATNTPIYFEGVGERVADFRPFHPSSMADRILGMGDTINLVRKMQEHVQEEDAKELEQKLRKASFTYEDFLKQFKMIKKMGSFKSLLGMLPGMSQLKELDIDEKQFLRTEAIIFSMTPREQREECELTVSRRRRIAKGSGTSVDEVNRLVKSHKQMKQFFKNIPSMKQLEKMIGGKNVWR